MPTEIKIICNVKNAQYSKKFLFPCEWILTAPLQPHCADFASAGTTNGGKCSGGYASHLEILPSLPRWEFPFFAFDGLEFSGRRLRRAWTSSLYYPVPCESVILVWYQRNSRAACLLSFRCNNERPEEEREWEEWKRWKERKKRKAALLILRIFLYSDSPCPRSRQSRRYYLISPASFPFYRANPSYANSPITHPTIAHSAFLLLFFLSLTSLACLWYAETIYPHIIFSLFICFHRTRPSTCRRDRWQYPGYKSNKGTVVISLIFFKL